MRKTYVLTRIASTHNNLRTDTVEGTILSFPTVGEPLVIFSEGLEIPDSVRMVYTTPIEELVVLCAIPYVASFRTLNSHYRIEELCPQFLRRID